MIRKRLLTIITGILVLGGLMMFFSLNGNKPLFKEEQQYQLEVQIAKMLVNDYEGVESIEFQGWGHSIETGMWGTTVIVNKQDEIGLSFSNISNLREISGIVTDVDLKLLKSKNFQEYPRLKDRINKIEKSSLKYIEITYSKNKKDK